MLELNTSWQRKDSATPSTYYGYTIGLSSSDTDNVWVVRKVTGTSSSGTYSEAVSWSNGEFSYISKWSERANLCVSPSTAVSITYSVINMTHSFGSSTSLNIAWNRISGVDKYRISISESGIVYNYLGHPALNPNNLSPITEEVIPNSGTTASYLYKYATTGKTYSVVVLALNISGSTSSSANINT